MYEGRGSKLLSYWSGWSVRFLKLARMEVPFGHDPTPYQLSYRDRQMKLFLLFLVTIFSYTTSKELCPEVNVIKAFDVVKFLGVWYQFAISGDLFNDPCEKSVTLDWAQHGDGKNITITTYRVCSKGMICRQKQTIWKAELGDPDEKTGLTDGKLHLTVDRPDFGKASVDLLVLNTDYTHSAVLYTCNIVSKRSMAIWILTRKQKPTDMEMADILTTVDATLETNHLDQYEFRLTNPKCASVVENNYKTKKQSTEEAAIPVMKSPSSSTNTSTTHQTNSGTKSNKSNNATDDENNHRKLNTDLALSEVNHNKTRALGQKSNYSSPTSENPLIPENDNFTSFGLNRTLKSAVDTLSNSNVEGEINKPVLSSLENSPIKKSTNDSFHSTILNRTVDNVSDNVHLSPSRSNSKEKSEKHILYSVLENLLKQKPTNDSLTSGRLNKTFNSNGSKIPSTVGKDQAEKNVLYSVLQNLLKQTPTNDSLTKIGLNRTCNSNGGKLFGTDDKNKKEIDLLRSFLENLQTQNSNNNNFTNSIANKLSNKDRKLSRRNKKGKLHSTFEPEQNVLQGLPEHSLQETPVQDSYSHRLSGVDKSNSGYTLSGTKELQPKEKVRDEGFFPSLARQTFFNYIPKAFNFDFWRI